MIILVIMMIMLLVMMIILRSWWWLARKKHENEKPLGADSVEYWSLQRSGENGIFFLRTISNISYNSNTKINLCELCQIFFINQTQKNLCVNYFKYLLQLKHKNKLICELFQIFPATQTQKNQSANIFTNPKSQFAFCKVLQIFSTIQT